MEFPPLWLIGEDATHPGVARMQPVRARDKRVRLYPAADVVINKPAFERGWYAVNVEAGRALQAVMLLSLSCHMHTLKALMYQMMVECGGLQEQFCD